MALVKMDVYGITHCASCHAEIACDENGDMPEVCPVCSSALEWDEFENRQKETNTGRKEPYRVHR